jgi:hypothetical protein
MMKKIITLLIFLFSAYSAIEAQSDYTIEGGWITGHNQPRYNNRPIYLHNTDAFILTGDKPICRFAQGENLYGTLFLSYVRNNEEKPLYEFDDIKSYYRGGRMKWVLKDHSFPTSLITMELVSNDSHFGAEIKISVKGNSSDRLRWSYGGKEKRKGEVLSWTLDVMGHPELLKWDIGKDFALEKTELMPAQKTYYISAVMNEQHSLSIFEGREQEFEKSLAKNTAFNSRLQINTPDKYLNAMAEASLTAVNGCWYPPVFVHGCMQWNKALPGWRTMFGGIAYGWHDRIFEEAKHYIESQITNSNKTEAKADSSKLYTVQNKESRFYGIGRIQKDQDFYDMQSQFFDQLVEEYRWTNSSQLLTILRPALELHLKWMEDCFDPDGDGLYESYINTWPTDAQWYNGGGTAEETSYAYRAHCAAMDMALAAYDTVSSHHHQMMMNRIKKSFQERLWIKEMGCSGAYREQGGLERVHTNPWLYSIFLPIDAKLTTQVQNIESLYYPEWALQNDTIHQDGRMIWTSNWVPGIWSVRELWPGDNYHLALSYFQSGLSNEGWEILKGTFMHTGFYHTVPGNLGSSQGGIDFGDCLHPFVRSVVSGLFGYNPDYPNGKVLFSPSFPTDWKQAHIKIPDYSLTFKTIGNTLSYDIELNKEAVIKLQIPVQCTGIDRVTINGKRVSYQIVPMAGRSMLIAQSDLTKKLVLQINYKSALPYYKPERLTFPVNSIQCIQIPDCHILSIEDPQGIMQNVKIQDDKISCQITDKTGFHTAIAKVKSGSCEQWRILHLKIEDNEKEHNEDINNMAGCDLHTFSWNPIDISNYYNADVRKIFQQQYLSPRPNTVSVRIGSNGYSPWAFTFWKSKTPIIELNKVEPYLMQDNRLKAPQGVVYQWNNKREKNIAFTSLWDNYPHETTIAMDHQEGKCISFLVCGSTNVMQCDIANAEIIIYYDNGKTDCVKLIPPYNYWNLCAIDSQATGPGQPSRTYYTSDIDKFCLHGHSPLSFELGNNCRAMILNRRLSPNMSINKIILRCLSQEVVVGLMGVSIGR